MEIWVKLEFGEGDFEDGFAKNHLEVNIANAQSQIKPIKFHLPPDQEIPLFYERWKQQYYSLLNGYRGSFKTNQITHISKTDCRNYAESLRNKLHDWLFPLHSKLIEILPAKPDLEISLFIHTQKIKCLKTKDILHRLPWQEWDFLARNSAVEAAVCFNTVDTITKISTSSTSKLRRARIISIFGESNNIDTVVDQELLKNLHKRAAELIVLKEPNRSDFSALWEEAYDILFFAGHSATKSDGQTGVININAEDSLSLEEIKKTLRSAISKGLKLAIFNSCDGLGLARQLADLNLPYIIVWREVVPDKSAQKFLQYFLSSFSQGESLFNSVRQARDKLKELADDKDIEKRLPGVSWLPIICQNTMTPPPTWEDLGGIAGELPDCPYQGLSAFYQENTDFFFGREKVINQLVEAVNNQPLVTVIGASGSGKSSVVFSGLLPRLQANIHVEIVTFRPGKNPFDALAIAFSKYLHSQPKKTTHTAKRLAELELDINLQHDEQLLYQFIESTIISAKDQHLVLVADQFEELYTLSDKEEAYKFLNALLFAVNHASQFTLVLTMRADFLGIALDYQPMGKALQQYPPLLLTPMDKEELQEVIEKPAFKMKVELEEGLTNNLINDVGNHPGCLPLLEFALEQLWLKQKNWYLTHQAYTEIGGLKKALAQHADQIFKSLSTQEKQQAEKIFIQLVRPGEGTEDTKRLATLHEVKQENWSLVKHLADERLVVTGWDEVEQIETVEIVHEALIREWKTLQDWIEINREFRLWQEMLKSEVRAWQNNQLNSDILLTGIRLAVASNWYQQRREQLTQAEQYFINASIKRQQQEQRQHNRRQKMIISGLSGGLVLIFTLPGFAFWQWQNASLNEIKAISVYSKAFLVSGQYFDAMIEALKASKKLNQTIINLPFEIFHKKNNLQKQIDFVLEEALYKATKRNQLATHEDEVRDVSFSPDGQMIATASQDKTVKLWTVTGQEIATLTGHEDLVRSVKFSPTGKTIATASWDGNVKLWTTEGKLITNLLGNKIKVDSVTFSPDGKIIATGDAQGYIQLWNEEGKLIRTFQAHKQPILNLSFHPDGNMLASASQDKTVKLWNLDGTELQTLNRKDGHQDWVWSVTFSPDGQKIATASRDETLKIWDIKGNLIKTLTSHTNAVTSVSFSPDNQIIASASADTTVKIWSVSGEKIQTLKGHQDWVWSLNFSPDGKMIATASKDGTAKIWQIRKDKYQIHQAHQNAIYSLSFSPDGNKYATASEDNTIKLWERSGKLIKALKLENKQFTNVTFSPNGQIIATANNDGDIILWNHLGNEIKAFERHDKEWIWQVSFSPDGNTIASAVYDGTIEIRNLDGKLIHSIPAHKKGQDEEGEGVNSVTFSPDGKIIASAGWDRKVKLWTLDGKLLKTFAEHNDGVHSVSFSPDGKIIATASQDKTVKLWTLAGELITTLKGHNSAVFRVRFSPDGQIIATASLDNKVKLWNLEGKELKTYQGHDDDVFSLDFHPDGKTLASADKAGKLIVWDLNLQHDQLIVDACNWVSDYLQNNTKLNESDRNLCM